MRSESDLKRDVENELTWEPSVNEAHIGVTVKDGVVTLTGHVPCYAEKYGAEKAAKRIYGVKAIANELDVRLPGCARCTDEEIAQACVSALKFNHAVPGEKVKVMVNDGWVTLEGEVQWRYQKDAAESAVRFLTGVTGVSNGIVVKPQVSPSEVKDKIEAAFKRNAEIDARRVSVEARGSKIILHGRVRSWAESDEAYQAAWAAPGVTEVDNRLTVTP